MRSFVRVGNFAVLFAAATVTATLSGQTPPPQSGTSAPQTTTSGRGSGAPRGKSSPFVGTWILNVSKSTYEGIPPEQRRSPSTRTIDVYADGYFIETHRNKTGGGREGFFYWHGKPGGPEFPEYGRTGGDAPGNKLTIKVNNERQWAVTFRNQRNQIVLSDTWTVSPDNKTLTIDRHGISPEGKEINHSVEVFDNEGWAMPRPPTQ
jgi:hypothetical protein